jgi:hypothetical protein
VIGDLGGNARQAYPTRWTLQLADGIHVDVTGEFAFMDHSCRPTARFDADARVRALVDLAPGDPVTLFYPRTEWLMAEAFFCRCGEPACLGFVSGAHAIPMGVLVALEAAEHVLALASARDTAAEAASL